MNDSTRSNERSLPSKESFKYILTDEWISDDDYNHAQNVWKNLSLQNNERLS